MPVSEEEMARQHQLRVEIEVERKRVRAQKNKAISNLLCDVRGQQCGTRVPIKNAVAQWRIHRPGSTNTDRWIVKHITSSSTLQQLLNPYKDGGRWTVNGAVLKGMEGWMWTFNYDSTDLMSE